MVQLTFPVIAMGWIISIYQRGTASLIRIHQLMMEKPEIQDAAVFADGVSNIVEAQQHAAEAYFTDGSIDDACPPLRALLHIMVHGQYQGKDISHPELRALFTREALLESDWYKQRLQTKRQRPRSSFSVSNCNWKSFRPVIIL